MIRELKTRLMPYIPWTSFGSAPSFLIIGAQKAGTSALFKMLASHPSISAPEEKEHHFFDLNEAYERGFGEYLKGFPRPRLFRKPPFTFEATPSYMYFEDAIGRINRHLPTIRLVVILRDPVERAYSAWNMFRNFKNDVKYKHLHDARTFDEAVNDEMAGRTSLRAHKYLERGHYAEQLQRIFATVGRERVLVLKYHEFKRDPAKVLDTLCLFLRVSPFPVNGHPVGMKANVHPYSSTIDPATRIKLDQYFKPHSMALKQLLGQEWELNVTTLNA